MFFLLIKQVIASIISGEAINKFDEIVIKLLFWKVVPKKIAARKVLPTSPINIFAGYQLKIKNPNNEPINAYSPIENVDWIDIVIKIIRKDPEINPSIPSIKFTKLIIPTEQNSKVKKIKIKITIDRFWNFDKKLISIIDEVNIWKKNLYLIETFFISSAKDMAINGMHNNGRNIINDFSLTKKSNIENNIVVKEKIMPPPVGLQNKWELLSFGRSMRNLWKYGIIALNNK